jgi:hypothetical protein
VMIQRFDVCSQQQPVVSQVARHSDIITAAATVCQLHSSAVVKVRCSRTCTIAFNSHNYNSSCCGSSP